MKNVQEMKSKHVLLKEYTYQKAPVEKGYNNRTLYINLSENIIKEKLLSGNPENLQEKLVQAGAVKVDPVLMNIEKRGKMMFGIWANMIMKKGAYNDRAREGRLKCFKDYLFTVIYLISPFATGLFHLIFLLNRAAAKKVVKKYSGI